jgi:ubiquitin-protein ligase
MTIHKEPNLTSPANSELSDMYLKDSKAYENYIRSQAGIYEMREDFHFDTTL